MRRAKEVLAPSQLLLTLTVLSNECLGFHLPGSLSKRIESPALNNTDFIGRVLNNVNQYRAQQDADNLTWSSELALEASNWANECKFETLVSKACTVSRR